MGSPPLMLGIEGVLDKGEVGGAFLGALPGHLQRARYFVVAFLQVLARPGLASRELLAAGNLTSEPRD